MKKYAVNIRRENGDAINLLDIGTNVKTATNTLNAVEVALACTNAQRVALTLFEYAKKKSGAPRPPAGKVLDQRSVGKAAFDQMVAAVASIEG